MAIDPVTEKVRWRVPVNGMPNHMTVTRDGKFIFVALQRPVDRRHRH